MANNLFLLAFLEYLQSVEPCNTKAELRQQYAYFAPRFQGPRVSFSKVWTALHSRYLSSKKQRIFWKSSRAVDQTILLRQQQRNQQHNQLLHQVPSQPTQQPSQGAQQSSQGAQQSSQGAQQSSQGAQQSSQGAQQSSQGAQQPSQGAQQTRPTRQEKKEWQPKKINHAGQGPQPTSSPWDFSALKDALDHAGQGDFEDDKNGITISHPDFGIVHTREIKFSKFVIGNIGSETHYLIGCEPMRESTYFGVSDKGHLSDPQYRGVCWPVEILPNGSYHVDITCRASDPGLLRFAVLFRFEGPFEIMRYITIDVVPLGDDAIILKPVSPYTRPPPVSTAIPAHIVPGEPPASGAYVRNQREHLSWYSVPAKLQNMSNKDIASVDALLSAPVTLDSYAKHFQTLLWMEELQQQVDIRRYDMESVMTCDGKYLSLKVPGLAEKRPSVLYRDSVYVTDPDFPDREFEGCVHDVRQLDVLLAFSRSFHNAFINGKIYKIRFSFSRVPLRRMHRAVIKSQLQVARKAIPDMLFPACEMFLPVDEKPLVLFNSKLNREQLRAVKSIVFNHDRNAPYVIFGPPGTGKTVTVVEAIKQIYKRDKDSIILACAPSNSAADLLAQRLADFVEKRYMLRVNAYSRRRADVPSDVFVYSNQWDDENRVFVEPPLNELMSYRVIIATCMTAANIAALHMPTGHFSHVFVDEAGQATEPECLCAIASIAGPKTSVVLSGDPRQLGPVIRSPVATREVNGLNTSFLERLMKLPIYFRDSKYEQYGFYNPTYVTKLVDNYRAHPAILQVPSQLFYDSELEACADPVLVNSLCGWDELPNKNVPIIFHGIEGKDEREGNSPSWFNSHEALKVLEYVKKLMEYRQASLRMEMIGVISPYRKQVEKLRLLFQKNGLRDIKVGSVEEFQGQERRVIIISTVRSQEANIDFDLSFRLGFLKNPKRFNVAVTRPQALLIVVGNPHVLVNDSCWREMFIYCTANKVYRGCSPPVFQETTPPAVPESELDETERLYRSFFP